MSKLSSPSGLLLGVIQDVPVSKIKIRSHLIRPQLQSISELADSINQKGLLQPIVVRSIDEFFEIVAGNRRYQACRSLGWRKIACHIVELNDKEAFEVSIIENLQRKTLSPIEEGSAFKAYVSDFGWGAISELADKIGRSVSYVTKRIKLLDLPADLLDSIINSKVTTSTAEELAFIKDKNKQSELGQLVSQRKLSMRNVRELVKRIDSEPCSENNSLHLVITHPKIDEVDRLTLRSFDKSIIALRIAMNTLGGIVGGVEDNWIIYEILMQHKNMLHSQIDLLIKQKRKI
jgi:ParB family transcriptional regulator, chromosome partitioning protein